MAVVPLALMICNIAITSAYPQTDESKTGVGPRGTKVAPSTDPSQSGSASTPQPPSGVEKSGTPVAKDNADAMKAQPPANSGKK
jgi:hypothetical protein